MSLSTATPARLDAWTGCPRRYRFHYLDRPRPARAGAWAHLSLGGAVHRALAGWWAAPRPDERPAPDRVADRVAEQVADQVVQEWVDDGFRDAEQSQRWRERAQVWVHRYVSAETARRVGIGDPVRVEATLSVRCSPTVALSGRPDRVDERPGPDGPELVVVDYKTSRRVPTQDDARASRTLAVYAAAAEAVLRRPALRVELHHLPSGQVVPWRHDREARDRQVQRAVAVAEECRDADARYAAGDHQGFPARPGPLCAWCDYRVCCAEGAAAAEAAAPWAALESGEEPIGS